MAQTLTLETTVIQRETRRTAEILFVPAESLGLAVPRTPIDAAEIVGLQPGVSVETSEEIQDVSFASLAGRVYHFDEGSFDRWRPQRLASRGSADAVFAEQLATQDFCASVEFSDTWRLSYHTCRTRNGVDGIRC